MPFTLEDIVPWGRSFGEYRRRFNLTDTDLQQRVLDCAGGPSRFNCEMARVAHEVRIFPLLDVGGTPSPHAEHVAAALEDGGYTVTLDPVPYEFQQGGDRMMKMTRPKRRA